MDKYSAEDFLKRNIMEQSRHLFLYGYNDDARRHLISSIREYYPVIQNDNRPMAIYLESIGLPKIDYDFKDDKDRLSIISREYLYFNIADSIITSSKDIDRETLNEGLKRLYFITNKYFLSHGFDDIRDIDKLQSYIKKTQVYYLEKYKSGSIKDISLSEIALPFLELNTFIGEYKKALNNNSYFGIIVDNNTELSLSATKKINDLVGSRINSDISMKVFTEPDKWNCYFDSNGNVVQGTHDYGSVELDESYNLYMKKMMKRFK